MKGKHAKLGLWTLGAAIILFVILFVAVRMSQAKEGFYAKALAKAPVKSNPCTDGTFQQQYENAVNNYTIASYSNNQSLMDSTQATIQQLSGQIKNTCGFFPSQKGWGNMTTSEIITITDLCKKGGVYQQQYNNLVAQMKIASLDPNYLSNQLAQQQQQLIQGLSGTVHDKCGFFASNNWPSTFVPPSR
jgi:hypothetical protein